MFKSALILLLFSATAHSNNVSASDDEQYKHAIIIDENGCSNRTILQEGNVWLLVKSEFTIDSAKCWKDEAKDGFTWDKGFAKVSFPQHHTLLLFLENIDQSFTGKWNCMFVGRDNSKLVSCAIDVQVRGTFQSANAVMQNSRSSVPSVDSWICIGILIGIILILIIALAAVIIFYKRKMNRQECKPEDICNHKRLGDRPSLNTPEEPVVEFENIDNKLIPDRISTTSENIYEGVYNHDAGMLRRAPVIPQKATRLVTIKRR